MKRCACGNIACSRKIGAWVCERCEAIEKKLYTDQHFNFQIFRGNIRWSDNPKQFRLKEDILRCNIAHYETGKP